VESIELSDDADRSESDDPNLVASNTLNDPLTTNPLAMNNPLSKEVAVLTVTASPKIAAHIFIADIELTDSNIAAPCYQPIPVSRLAVSLQLFSCRRSVSLYENGALPDLMKNVF
jgi:hypothetical protein